MANTKTNPNATDLGDVEYVVEESRTVPDGHHQGAVDHAQIMERGEEGFRYFDLYLKDAESGVVVKAGYAASRITPETELGRLLARFGAPVAPDQTVRPVQVFKPGLAVQFDTVTERTKNGRFARVQLETVAPLEE